MFGVAFLFVFASPCFSDVEDNHGAQVVDAVVPPLLEQVSMPMRICDLRIRLGSFTSGPLAG